MSLGAFSGRLLGRSGRTLVTYGHLCRGWAHRGEFITWWMGMDQNAEGKVQIGAELAPIWTPNRVDFPAKTAYIRAPVGSRAPLRA